MWSDQLVHCERELNLRRLIIDLTTNFKISNNYTDIIIYDIFNILNNCRTWGKQIKYIIMVIQLKI